MRREDGVRFYFSNQRLLFKSESFKLTLSPMLLLESSPTDAAIGHSWAPQAPINHFD